MNKLTALLLGTLLTAALAAPAFASDGLRLAPRSVSFGRQVIGTCQGESLVDCKLRTLTITNTTDAPLTISSIGFRDTPAPTGDIAFELASNTCVTTLEPGESCAIRFTAFPLTTGRVAGEIRIFGASLLTVIAVRTTGT